MIWRVLAFLGLLMAAPANDNVASAEVISALPYATTVDVTDATEEGTDPVPSGVVGVGSSTKTVWWKWTSNVTGRVQVSCIGSNYNTMLSVWTGSPGSFVQVAANDDQSFNTESGLNQQTASETVINATAGTTYYIMVGRKTGSNASLVFKMWADTASGAITIVQTVASAAASLPSFTDSQGQYFRIAFTSLYDNSALVAQAAVRYVQNASAGTHTLGGATLTGVTAGNTLFFIAWMNDGSAIEHWMFEVSGLSMVSPRDVTFDSFGNAQNVGVYETPFPASATSHKHANAAPTQTSPGMWLAANVSNADKVASTPTGFTALADNDAQRRVFYKVTSATESNDAPFTTTTAALLAAGMVSFRVAVPVTVSASIDDNAEICCSKNGETVSGPDNGGGTSNGSDVNPLPLIGSQIECVGGGLVDEQAPLTFSEAWW